MQVIYLHREQMKEQSQRVEETQEESRKKVNEQEVA